MQEEKIETIQELTDMVKSQKNDFIIHVEWGEEEPNEQKGSISS